MYTSYFANIRKIPPTFIPIAISRIIPGYVLAFPYYKKLAPTYEMVMDYKDGLITWDEYELMYKNDILSKLDPKTVIEELTKMTGGKPWVLVCYEGLDKPCHRHIVANWLCEAGYNCKEWED